MIIHTFQDLDTNSESPVTAISSDMDDSQTFVASFGDGMVKIFDRRIEEEDSIVRTYSDHTSWVQNVCWHPKQGLQLLSARSVSFRSKHYGG
jgi:regulator-associated protein of mTOR